MKVLSVQKRQLFKSPAWFHLLLTVLVAGTLVFAAIEMVENAFIQDDAFIAFRYARNLAEGRGVVYNPGEYVEGYTDPLWVALMAGSLLLGISPIWASSMLGYLSSLVATALVFWFVWCFYTRTSEERHPSDLAPFCAVLLLPLNRSWTAYATGGLETSFFAMLAMLSIVLTLFHRDQSKTLFVASNLSFLALCLTRPDGLLLYGITNVALVGLHRESPARILRWNVPFAVAFTLFLGWKLVYYGHLLPNTYHAKSVTVPYLDRGWVYLKAFYVGYGYPILAIALPMGVGLTLAARSKWVTVETSLRRACGLYLLPLVVAVVAFNLYVGWVGGGFMEWKPLMHVYPLTVTAICVSLLALQRSIRHARFVVPILVLIVICGSPRKIPVADLPEHVLSTQSLASQIAPRRWARIGRALRFRLPPDTIIATSAAGAIPYFSRLYTVDIAGLTDATVGRQQLRKRGVVGHEKIASKTYLQSRKVNLVFRGLDFTEEEDIPEIPAGQLSVPNVYIRIGDGLWLCAEYLTKTPELTAFFRQNSDDFILVQVNPIPR